MSMSRGDVEQLQTRVAQAIREHWMLFLVEGVILVIRPSGVLSLSMIGCSTTFQDVAYGLGRHPGGSGSAAQPYI
jgi:hypothetical protein